MAVYSLCTAFHEATRDTNTSADTENDMIGLRLSVLFMIHVGGRVPWVEQLNFGGSVDSVHCSVVGVVEAAPGR